MFNLDQIDIKTPSETKNDSPIFARDHRSKFNQLETSKQETTNNVDILEAMQPTPTEKSVSGSTVKASLNSVNNLKKAAKNEKKNLKLCP